MNSRKYVIWDFNGTIIDDVDVSFRAANILLEEYGLKKISSHDEYRGMLCFPVIDYYRKLGFDFDKIDYKIPADRWVGLYRSLENEITLREDIVSTVRRLKENGFCQTVLSASDSNMLKSQLSSLGVIDLFDEIYGKDDVYAYGKLDLAEKWRQKHRDAAAVLVGDMPHDYDSAKVIGCPCVLVTGGHSTRENLDLCDGAVVIEDTGKLFDTVTRLMGV